MFSKKFWPLWVIVVGLIIDFMDPGTATTSSGKANPLYTIDQSLPAGISAGTGVALAGVIWAFFAGGV